MRHLWLNERVQLKPGGNAMRQGPWSELVQAHTRLCDELYTKREALAAVLCQMHGRLISATEIDAHRLAAAAVDDVKQRLSAVSLKMAANQ
jgi:hypothetical protein